MRFFRALIVTYLGAAHARLSSHKGGRNLQSKSVKTSKAIGKTTIQPIKSSKMKSSKMKSSKATINLPNNVPTDRPTHVPTNLPTQVPTNLPTHGPTNLPTHGSTNLPTNVPTNLSTHGPTNLPTHGPTGRPTDMPTVRPTEAPTNLPTNVPTNLPTNVPTDRPTDIPTGRPTDVPTNLPTNVPTSLGTNLPTNVPTNVPTNQPTNPPTNQATRRFLQGNTFPARNGQASNLQVQGGGEPMNVVCGAVQAVLSHPTDANICFAGATNGGVWKTTNCTSALPLWVPLTDMQSSNSVGDMVFGGDPNTVLVAIGTRSSTRTGGRGIGLLLTDNALDPVPTWENLDNQGLFRDWNLNFNSVYMQGDLILASAYTSDLGEECDKVGIWRSDDRGITWAQVLKGVSRVITHDPNDNNRFYATLDKVRECMEDATLPENGVFISNDLGVTWNAMPSQSTPLPDKGQLYNAKLSVSRDGSRIWSSILSSLSYQNIAYTDNNGDSWTTMDRICIPADANCTGLTKQGDLHHSLLASPMNKNEVYVGGTTVPLNSLGNRDYNGFIFRGNASIVGTNSTPSPQWEHMTNLDNFTKIPGGGTKSNSAPHSDSRDMELRADGAILEGNDGGITVRTEPSSNTGDWFSLCGNMQVFESHTLAYEPVLKSVLFGNQDNGVVVGQLGREGSFHQIGTGDGGVVMVDYNSNQDSIFLYFSAQEPESLQKHTMNKQSGEIRSLPNIPLEREAAFVPVTAMNSKNQSNFALAAAEGSFVMFYKFSTPEQFNRRTVDVFGDSLQSDITAMTYSSDGMFLYSVNRNTAVSKCIINPINGFPIGSCSVMSGQITPDGSIIKRMAVDPTNASRVVVVATDRQSSRPRVFESLNEGRNWNDITVVGSSINQAYNGQAVAFLSQGQVSFLVVGTSDGIYLRSGQDWNLLAEGMPTVAVFDMTYSSEDDRLVVSTLGRGVWFLSAAFDAANNLTGNAISFTPIIVTEPNITITIVDNAAFTPNPPDHIQPVYALPLDELFMY
ncbi:hypothetical protein HJC23_009448 [Cyclotella cryptica]|uniref:Uncharacterized protein n=1 Tax=Cyclotella cryptica TaxID=29204 RepID=A0ABD3Q719_9STRA|eukprot:CCRYP_009553-RA/>CCRYP_009553-RA protein AED:0.23 eAED:0.23 QI:0/0/0/1/1/1/3/0/1016